MVIKIQPPAKEQKIVLEYNEKKATGSEGLHDGLNDDGTSHVIHTENVPEGKTIEEEFDRLFEKNSKTRGRHLENPTFHMSINPGPDDKILSEQEIVMLVKDVMKGLGYDKCPYRIYRHTDTGRIHYHVVSTRIGQDGKKINDSFENRRVNQLMSILKEKYGFNIGNQKTEPDQKTSKKLEIKEEQIADSQQKTTQRKPGSAPYNRNSTEGAASQFKRFHEEALEWHFSTIEQYEALLYWRYRTKASETSTGMTYTGLDINMEPCTGLIHEQELKRQCLEEIKKNISISNPAGKNRKQHVEKICKESMALAKNWEEYARRTEKLGIMTLIHRTSEGKSFGLTYMDKVTRCIWKGSETETDIKWLLNEASRKNFGEIPNVTLLLAIKSKKDHSVQKTRTNTTSTGTNIHKSERTLLERLADPRLISGNSRTHGSNKEAYDDHFLDTDKENAPRIKI